jgi:hypothetical protein
MAFYLGSEMNNDPTNWCGPNPSAIRSILQDLEFTKVKCNLQNAPCHKN